MPCALVCCVGQLPGCGPHSLLWWRAYKLYVLLHWMLLNDKSAVFALGLLGVIGYYGVQAMRRRVIAVVMPHAPEALTSVDSSCFGPFVAGMLQACKDRGCMLHYVCVPDAYRQYDALLRALTSSQLQGCPVICRILDPGMLHALEQAGSRFVAVMSPGWVASSPLHIASLLPWTAAAGASGAAPTAVLTSQAQWAPGCHVADASSFMTKATMLSRSGAQHLLIADPALVAHNPAAAPALRHLFRSVRLLPCPGYAEGYEAVVRAAAGN